MTQRPRVINSKVANGVYLRGLSGELSRVGGVADRGGCLAFPLE